MNGEGEGDGRKTDWPLVISIAALLFGVVQFVIALTDNTQARAVANEARLTVIECKLGLDKCGGGR